MILRVDAEGGWIDEAAAIDALGLGELGNPGGTLRRLCREGLPHYRVMRGVYRFRLPEILEWLEARRYTRRGGGMEKRHGVGVDQRAAE